MIDRKKYFSKKVLFSLFAGFLIFLLVKFLVIDVAIVNSSSMANTFTQGELVFIKPFFSPERNDVVQMSLPLCKADTGVTTSKIFKRIIGMPKDTVQIIHSKVFVNGNAIPENEFFLHNYIMKFRAQADTTVFKEIEITEKYLIDDSCAYMLSLTEKRFLELKDKKGKYTLVSNSEDWAVFDENVFPYQSEYKWNEDFFGPLYIPAKDDTLKLDTSSIKIYNRIIVDFENNKVGVKKNKIFINETETSFYIVKQNYYFVTGDNFDNSIDSRNWGFIPENKLKAKLLFRN